MPGYTVDGMRVSSTAVRNALAAGDLDLVKRLLGRPYSISGRVVRGDQLGKKIGFPTANVQLKHNRPPLSGIFVVEVEMEAEADNQSSYSIASTTGIAGSSQPGRAARPCMRMASRCWKFICSISIRIFMAATCGCIFFISCGMKKKYPDLATLTQQIGQDVRDAKQYFNPLSLSSSVTR